MFELRGTNNWDKKNIIRDILVMITWELIAWKKDTLPLCLKFGKYIRFLTESISDQWYEVRIDAPVCNDQADNVSEAREKSS